MNQGSAIVTAAVILGCAILGGAYWVGSSVDRASHELAALGEALDSLERAGAAAAPAAAARARRGPDPDRVYAVKTDGSPSRGPADAPVTIVEFSDFQCPFCSRVTSTLEEVRETYGDKVRIVFKHLPLSMHAKAPAAHAAAEAAHRQGRFWEMHDRIFANQREMSEAKYLEFAQELGLDLQRFREDAADPELRERVEADAREAARLGVTGTPGFFINGRFLSGAQPFPAFQTRIDAALASG